MQVCRALCNSKRRLRLLRCSPEEFSGGYLASPRGNRRPALVYCRSRAFPAGLDRGRHDRSFRENHRWCWWFCRRMRRSCRAYLFEHTPSRSRTMSATPTSTRLLSVLILEGHSHYRASPAHERGTLGGSVRYWKEERDERVWRAFEQAARRGADVCRRTTAARLGGRVRRRPSPASALRERPLRSRSLLGDLLRHRLIVAVLRPRPFPDGQGGAEANRPMRARPCFPPGFSEEGSRTNERDARRISKVLMSRPERLFRADTHGVGLRGTHGLRPFQPGQTSPVAAPAKCKYDKNEPRFSFRHGSPPCQVLGTTRSRALT